MMSAKRGTKKKQPKSRSRSSGINFMSGHFSDDSILQLCLNLWGEFKPGYHTLFGVTRTRCYIKVQVDCQSAKTISVSSWSTSSPGNDQIPSKFLQVFFYRNNTHVWRASPVWCHKMGLVPPNQRSSEAASLITRWRTRPLQKKIWLILDLWLSQSPGSSWWCCDSCRHWPK